MAQKPGRNDPCTCGSGKKYKNCCMQQEASKGNSLLGKRKFTAKVISSGGMKPAQQEGESHSNVKAMMDYNSLMERSFGDTLNEGSDSTSLAVDPANYLPNKNSEKE